MAIYTVHAPPGASVSAETADRLRFVKEGFSFWALAIPLFWLLWNRLWLALLGWLAVALLIQLVGRFVGEVAAAGVGLVFALWFALEAREILRWALARRGWTLVGVVEGGSLDTAERRFFEAWLAEPAAPAAPRTPPPLPGAPAPAARPAHVPIVPRPAGSAIVGLFPEAGGRK